VTTRTVLDIEADRLADAVAAAQLIGLPLTFVRFLRCPARVCVAVGTQRWAELTAEQQALMKYFEA
jgi:hypothetical protein